MIFFTVFKQVFILLLLIALGFLLTKRKIFTDAGIKSMTELVLLFVTPCVIIKSFIREYDPATLKYILISFAAAVGIHLLFIIVAHLLFRSKDQRNNCVLRFGVVFTNCGYMSLPLQEAVLGADGVLYGASFIAIFNLIVWSYGITLMSGDKKYISPKKLIFNPGIIGLVVGFFIFIFSVPMPEIISAPIGYLAALNTPLPMLIIGYHLAQSDIKKALTDISCIFAVVVRLVLLPLLAIGSLYLCGLRGNLYVSMVIAACAPTAAITTMFSAKFDRATDLSVNMVSISTILSLITMPLLVTLAQMIGG